MSDDCIFCRIARGELSTTFVAESEQNVAFRDLAPQAPTHVLVVPRQHLASLQHAVPEHADIVADALSLAAEVARREGLLESGFRVVTNDGPDAGQTVHHLHFHVLGGAPLHVGLG
ncbi:MAG: histidine triad nucleotide-binding protein [Thermomicrobiales bacterium]|nr:histidine triad nucleotide-binding protein [Thermomicrobiales bacterium]